MEKMKKDSKRLFPWWYEMTWCYPSGPVATLFLTITWDSYLAVAHQGELVCI